MYFKEYREITFGNTFFVISEPSEIKEGYTTSSIKITPVTIFIPFAKFINVVTVSSLLVIFLTFSNVKI